ncbi:MAG: hypothetical protein A2805_02000 [Candidatus Andersenbacteria bacterium RIFCSPHIGHO2_01_FULL_46_36]|uniref:DUF8128 domain-containing protein n=1 Tax=Candidatus Andersenbacteria bacterium RIFCSPHIGHO2_12_FULL_45_11 TaxID=1797281 RepID=A0A1G1X2B2_9BACT|nr:MAG: hypothetical protein A2805_02000 [Candidatus Andersenbacteria bacterium RIFCSPHIGHO2_01_FULL_46_36]OGY34155.1 MAG: hypothetical protein A3D99_00345 [Candidatus Andersenbacteria bacterium RIFCSPHIGHO2_12_FULL_45_11]QBM02273.1 hypothetical protein [uncultured archaeon]
MLYTFADFAQQFGPTILTLGWLLVVWMIFWIAWKTYLVMKMVDFVSAIEWTFYEIKLPDETEETPKSMEVLYEYVGGIHKGPDFNEKYFDGYLEPWASFELYCTQQSVRYIIVVPTAHKRLFEGIIYGQYPKADIQETEDYTQRYSYKDLRKKYEMWGSDVILTNDDILPIKTYPQFEAKLAEEVPFVDPMQIIVEALTNVEAGEEFWIQVMVRPLDAAIIKDWEKRGEKEIAKISGQAKKEKPGMWENFKNFMLAVPGEILSILFRGPLDFEKEKEEKVLRFFNPVDEAKMKGILEKISGNGYKTKIRIIHIAPVGQLKKPNIARGFGVFKQFNAWHLNGFAPDAETRTNKPNFIFRDRRRLWREKNILLNFQWRDFFGTDSGQIMNAEELATLYHFPVKYVSSPSVQRAKAGRQAPPANLPYA